MKSSQNNSQIEKLPQQYLNINFYAPNQVFASNFDNLSVSQQKKISLKKLEEEYCKTLEQAVSPNSSTINLENLKKTQSHHFMKVASGTSSPQQLKSRSSIGKYMQEAVAYNNFHQSNQHRNSAHVSKSQASNNLNCSASRMNNRLNNISVNQSANYGSHLNAFEFFQNANINLNNSTSTNKKTKIKSKIHVSTKKNSVQQNYPPPKLITNFDNTNQIDISRDRQTLKMKDFLKQIDAYSNENLDKLMPSSTQYSSMQQNNQSIFEIKVVQSVRNFLDKEMNVSSQDYQDDSRYNDSNHDPIDQRAFMSILHEGFSQIINTSHPIVGTTLQKLKDGYESLISRLSEELNIQTEILSSENNQLSMNNQNLEDKNIKMQKQLGESEQSYQSNLLKLNQQFKQNNQLAEELNKVIEENRMQKNKQRDLEKIIQEQQKQIDQLRQDLKFQLIMNQKTIQSQSQQNYQHQQQQQNQNFKISQINAHPKLNSGKHQIIEQQNSKIHQIIDDSSQSDYDEVDPEVAYINEQQKVIQQDKSPIQKPIIPMLNLNKLQVQKENASNSPKQHLPSQIKTIDKSFDSLSQSQHQQNYQSQQQVLPRPSAGGGMKIGMPKFQIDLSSINQQKQQKIQEQEQQESSQDYQFNQKPQDISGAPQAKPMGLGLNLAGLKNQKGIQDFQDEFMSRIDEYSQSWRDAAMREKRF
ncbi:UNKNOWN [Stylonychia lemnae]|uniref:Uncharacterized protein n=1 Tax=Stylonychia lemnae TaxID=5949 RepID=A0A078AV28_STYLE|nr:UNKNOWN [Stylonychia lemnae]|eukprot:CDW84718.1 UNKNOWN [Stylonychia lemnae]